MKTFLAVTALSFFSVCAFSQLPQDQIFRMNNPAVFTITATEADGATHIGSAFCLRQDGILVTTYHIIANASSATVRSIYDKDIKVLGTLAVSPEHDLAIIKVDDAGLSEVQLGQSEYTRANELVTIVASEAPSKNTFVKGKISADYKMEHIAQEYQMLIPVEGEFQPRYNGAPLLSGSGGRAMGVLLATDDPKEQYKVALAIPVEEVRTLMNRMSATPQPLSPQGAYFKTKEGLYWAGRLDEVNNDFDDALAHYKSALQLDARYYPALFQLGYDAELRGDHASAKDAFTKAKEFQQTASLAAYNLGLIDLLLNNLPSAEQNFQTATDNRDIAVKAYDKLGETLELEKQPEKALAAYMKARDLKETDIVSELRVAHILFDQQKWRDAAKAAKKAREAGVDSVDVYLIEADSWFHVHDYLQAWDLANRGTELRAGANLPRLWYLMAASDMKIKGNADRAKTELDKLQTLDPASAKELQDGSK